MTVTDKIQDYDNRLKTGAANRASEAQERRALDNKHLLESIQLELKWYMPTFSKALEQALDLGENKLAIRAPSVLKDIDLSNPEISLFRQGDQEPIPNPFWGYQKLFENYKYEFYADVKNSDETSTDLYLHASWHPVGRYWI